MDKNTVLAIVLSTLVLVGWFFWQTTVNPPVPQTQSSNSAEIESVTSEVVAKTENTSQEVLLQNQEEILEEEIFVISTDVVDITFTNKGGDIIGYELKEHRVGSEGVEMAENITEANRAFALSFGSSNNPIINDFFQAEVIDDYTIGFSKSYAVNNSGQTDYYTVKKLYTFDPTEYLFKLDIRIEGEGYSNLISSSDVAYTLRSSPQIGPYYDPGVDRYEHRTFNAYDGRKKDKKLNEGDTDLYEDAFNWIGVAGKYFTQQIITTDSSTVKGAVYSTVGRVDDFYDAQILVERKSTRNSSIQDTYYIYMGPKVDDTMVIYNNADENNWGLSNLRIDEILNSGWLAWLETILKFLMEIFYGIIPNWGVSIILMTILLKIVLYPLTKKSSMATLRMQELQPQIKEIQDKYKGQTEKLNVEMAKFYKEAGYNPMSGCLPLLIQFPLIFAMFGLFNNYFEFRGAMFIPGWIPDLSVSDSIGIFPDVIPFIGGMSISILPVIYVASQLLFTKITQSSATAGSNNQMKMMMYFMPLIFFFMFYTAPAGLLLYWTVSNFLQLVQQVTINKIMHRKRKEMGLDTPKKEVALPPSAKKRKKN